MDGAGPPGLPGPPLLRVPRPGPEARRQYADHPAYDLAEQFADEWDQTSFDPDYDTLPLEHFESLAREIFSAPRWS